MEMYLVLHPGSPIMAIHAVLSHRKDMVKDEVKDSRRRSLMFVAAFLAVASA